MTKPSRMRIEAVWDHETGFGKLTVAGDPDGHYYFGPAIDLYLHDLKLDWEADRAKCFAEGVAHGALLSKINRLIDET